jgi:hypothetical protein
MLKRIQSPPLRLLRAVDEVDVVVVEAAGILPHKTPLPPPASGRSAVYMWIGIGQIS